MRSRLTKEDKKVLRALGYTNSNEDGAVMEHKTLIEDDLPVFIWPEQTLTEVLERHNQLVVDNTLRRAQTCLSELRNSLKASR